MFLTLLLLPFIAAFSTGLLGRSIGIKGSYFITLTLLFISSFLSIVLGYEVILSGSPVSLRLGC
jgi:NADH:ubiquinone oxidoreductase subunit 5 (subunit L)/multisubunit Na+/H+ antiporter MnhA subunit